MSLWIICKRGIIRTNKMIKSDIEYEKLKRGNKLIYARVISKIGYYELLDVHLVSHYKDYCTVTNIKTRQTYLIGRSLSREVLYISRRLALKYLVEQQKNKDVIVASE